MAGLATLPLLVRMLLAGLAGAVAAFAMPPSGWVLALILMHSAAFLLLSSVRTSWGGFAILWAAAFGFHVVGLSWVGEAFLVDAERFASMRPFAMAGLPAGLALFAGLAGAVFIRLRRQHGPMAGLILYASLFTASEWLRGTILTGFPWNLPVHGWMNWGSALQATAWIGPYGLSLVTVLAAAAPALLLLAPSRRSVPLVAASLAPLVLVVALGHLRLADAPAQVTPVADVRLRLVQANIPQKEKWLPDKRVEHFRKHLSLSLADSAQTPTHVIWPEAATAFLLLESPDALAAAAAVAPVGGALITGTLRRVSETDARQIANSVAVVTGTGAVPSVYDKHHLVPFGEYMPLARWLPIERMVQGPGSFAFGPGPQTIAVPGAPAMSPLICYEAIFPGEAVGGERPGWLLNVTNDAWFGTSAGPHQHLAMARLRAIELGLPLVRVANTGISAVVDPYGRVLQRLGIGETGVIDAPLPEALEPTLYAVAGDYPFLAALLLMLWGGSRLRPNRRVPA